MSGPDGDVVAELRLLTEAVLDRLGPWLDAAAAGEVGAAAGCGWCPLCALAAALRGERPELSRRLAEQGVGVLLALRSVLEGHEHPPPDTAAAHPPPDTAAASPPPPRVQHVPVRRRSPR